MDIEEILDPDLNIERMISGTYGRALEGDADAIAIMGN